MRNVSEKRVVEEIKTHFIFVTFFSENRAVYQIIAEKYCAAIQATDDNIIWGM
jgi:hypothetical protein